MYVGGHFGEEIHQGIFPEFLDFFRHFRRHLVVVADTEFFFAVRTEACPVFELAFFKVKVRLIPKDGFDLRVANACNPTVHVCAEFRMVRACGDRCFAVERDLAHVVIAGGEFRIGFSAEDAPDSPRIDVNIQSEFDRLLDDFLHRLRIILFVFFGPGVQNMRKTSVADFPKIFYSSFWIADTEIGDTFFHDFKDGRRKRSTTAANRLRQIRVAGHLPIPPCGLASA